MYIRLNRYQYYSLGLHVMKRHFHTPPQNPVLVIQAHETQKQHTLKPKPLNPKLLNPKP